MMTRINNPEVIAGRYPFRGVFVPEGAGVMERKALQIGRTLFLVGAMLFLALAVLWLLGGPLVSRPPIALAQAGTGVIRVATIGVDTPGCGGQGNPCRTVQHAVDQALPGEEIRIAAGLYTGVSARAGVTQVVYINKSIILRGGYSTADWSNSDPQANPTTLDAEKQGRVLYITGDVNPTIRGLRIRRGNAAQGGGKDQGGGVYLTDAAATISNNHVYSNAAQYGGGLYLNSSAATLSGNTVTSNTVQASSSAGGGLYLRDSDAMLAGNRIEGNTALDDGFGWSAGGGLYLRYSDATLTGNRIQGNAVTAFSGGGGGVYLYRSEAMLKGNRVQGNTVKLFGDGGGVYLNRSVAALSGNTITSNSTQNKGGGLYLLKSDATLTNTLVADNRAYAMGSGLYIAGSSPRLLHTTIVRNDGFDGSGVYVDKDGSNTSSITLTNTILVSHTVGITVTSGNTAMLDSTLWHGNAPNWGGPGTITHKNDYTGPPAFVGPEAGDYHIGSGSAALDRGVDAGVRSDMDPDPRPYQTPDLGADEYWPPGALKVVSLPLVGKDHWR